MLLQGLERLAHEGRMYRTAVLFLAVLLFFVGHGWGACDVFQGIVIPNYTCSGYCREGSPSVRCDFAAAVGTCPAGQHCGSLGLTQPYECNCADNSGIVGKCTYYICTTQCEADSVACLNKGGDWEWKGCELGCVENTCDSQCECEENGGTWQPSNGGYCVPRCESQFCCDSLNQNLPVETDTTWEGCAATDPANDRCVVIPTTANNTGSTQAECTAKSRYRICTTSYVWSRTAGQCAPISSNNCVTVDVSDERCTKVMCEAYQTRSVGHLTYNGATQCYEGTQLVQDMMVCDNGIREERGRNTEVFQVCDSYLDANNLTIQDYLSGQNGGSSVVGGNSAGGGGGGGGGGEDDYVGCIGNGCGSPLDGGKSVNALGDTVDNSPSPQFNTVWTPQTNVVTSYDSATGTTQVVKNSLGGDSVTTSVKPSGVRCLGVSGGIATLTNGYNTWTCEAMSCGQAVVSASINGGACSAKAANGLGQYDYNSNMPTIDIGELQTGSEFYDLERGLNALASAINAAHYKDSLQRLQISRTDRAHDDSLWKATFGTGLDAVRNMEHYIASASSANSNAIASATSSINSVNSNAIASATSSINSATSTAMTNAASAVTSRLTTVQNNLISANSQAIASATSSINSANSQAIGSLTFALEGKLTTVNTSIMSASSANSSVVNSVRDTLHRSNGFLEGILNSLDTGGIVNRDLNGIREAVEGLPAQVGDVYAVSLENWYNDKLKLTLDSNAQKVADAIDSLHLEVRLDSIRVDVPKDSTVSS